MGSTEVNVTLFQINTTALVKGAFYQCFLLMLRLRLDFTCLSTVLSFQSLALGLGCHISLKVLILGFVL